MQSPYTPNDDKGRRKIGPQTEIDEQRQYSAKTARNPRSQEANGGREMKAKEKEWRAKNEKEGGDD